MLRSRVSRASSSNARAWRTTAVCSGSTRSSLPVAESPSLTRACCSEASACSTRNLKSLWSSLPMTWPFFTRVPRSTVISARRPATLVPSTTWSSAARVPVAVTVRATVRSAAGVTLTSRGGGPAGLGFCSSAPTEPCPWQPHSRRVRPRAKVVRTWGDIRLMIPLPARPGGRVLLGRSGRSDGDTLGAVPGNRLGHQARGLHFLDERAQEPRGSLAVLWSADRLLDRRELSVEDPGAREFLDVGQEPRLEAGQRLELLGHEHLERGIEALRHHQLRVLDRAGQIEAVRALIGHGDPHALAVDLGDGANRRPRGHEIGRGNLEIGGRERDLGRTLRLRAEERHVPRAGLDAIAELARGLELDELHGHADSPAELAGNIGRDAAGISRRRARGDQQEVSVVEPDPELSGRRDLGSNSGRDLGSHGARR